MTRNSVVNRLARIDATADEILDLAPVNTPRGMLAELDAITDVGRQLVDGLTGDKYEQAMTLVARLERVADHYEEQHGLCEQPQESRNDDGLNASRYQRAR